jgi:hypothetical protein
MKGQSDMGIRKKSAAVTRQQTTIPAGPEARPDTPDDDAPGLAVKLPIIGPNDEFVAVVKALSA